MKNLSRIRPLSPSQQERLARWETLYRSAQEISSAFDEDWPFEPLGSLEPLESLDASTPPSGLSAESSLSHLVACYDSPSRTGEIRLLSNPLTPHSERPIYVAVLTEWKHRGFDGFLIAPFSPFEEPATTTELSFPDRAPTLRVLELWNSYSIHSHLLEKGWSVDDLSPTELDDAQTVLRHALRGSRLPAHLTDRVGSPITSSTDLRRSYQASEVSIMEHLADLVQQSLTPLALSPVIPFPADFHTHAQTTENALAAASPDICPQSPKMDFSATKGDTRYTLTLERYENSFFLSVFDTDEQISSGLDQARILDAESHAPLAEIAAGKASFPAEKTLLQHGFLLESPDALPIEISIG